MKNLTIGITLATLAFNASAADERQASNIVKKFSQTVACQLGDVKNQYKAVKLTASDENGIGAQFVVFWEGDISCMGGASTATPNFTLVEQAGFSSVAPIVRLDIKFPELDLVYLTSMSAKNGVLSIKGITYGPQDQQGNPKKLVSYNLKLNENKFVKI